VLALAPDEFASKRLPCLVYRYINVPLSTYCKVKFDTYRNLQQHRKVLSAIAWLLVLQVVLLLLPNKATV